MSSLCRRLSSIDHDSSAPRNQGKPNLRRKDLRKGPFAFHYVISDAVVYLAMTPKSYPKRAIFRYLYLDAPAAREAWSKRDRVADDQRNLADGRGDPEFPVEAEDVALERRRDGGDRRGARRGADGRVHGAFAAGVDVARERSRL